MKTPSRGHSKPQNNFEAIFVASTFTIEAGLQRVRSDGEGRTNFSRLRVGYESVRKKRNQVVPGYGKSRFRSILRQCKRKPSVTKLRWANGNTTPTNL